MAVRARGPFSRQIPVGRFSDPAKSIPKKIMDVSRGLLDGQSEFLNHFFAHSELLNLSGNRHRELGNKPDVSRDFIRCDLIPAEVAQFIDSCLLSFAQPDPGTYFFT